MKKNFTNDELWTAVKVFMHNLDVMHETVDDEDDELYLDWYATYHGLFF